MAEYDGKLVMHLCGNYIGFMRKSIRNTQIKSAESLNSPDKVGGTEDDVRDEVKRVTEWVMRRYERTLKALAK
ncbi:MAG: hypothetical protein ACK4ZN_12505 [Oceanibaculum sp.]